MDTSLEIAKLIRQGTKEDLLRQEGSAEFFEKNYTEAIKKTVSIFEKSKEFEGTFAERYYDKLYKEFSVPVVEKALISSKNNVCQAYASLKGFDNIEDLITTERV